MRGGESAFLEFRQESRFLLPLLQVHLPVGLSGLTSFFLGGAIEIAISEDFCFDPTDGLVQCGFLQLAFPDDDDRPALSLQFAPDFLVTLLVACNLGLPEVGVGLGCRGVLAVLVAMPEAAVDEDDGAVLGQNDVRGTGEALDVYAVAEAEVPQFLA